MARTDLVQSWWVLLLCMGPLVGVSFISAVRTYGEVSGLNGTAAGVGEALSPLIGVWAPTFSACELAAVFLLPFVAIRLVAGDRQSGALKLELQQGMSPLARVAAKALVLLAGWLVAMLPPLQRPPALEELRRHASTRPNWSCWSGATCSTRGSRSRSRPPWHRSPSIPRQPRS